MVQAFDAVSGQYQNKALVQQKASQKLLTLLEIKNSDSVLDVGCGPGHITKAIVDLSSAKVVGTDISSGMIKQAQKSYPEIYFQQINVEELPYREEFDIVFCNSTFQWFKKPEVAIAKMYQALKPQGRIGIACPGTEQWSPWFQKIIPAVLEKPEINKIFKHWQNPWVFLPDLKSYQNFFEKAGFKTKYISVDYETKKYTVEEAYNIYLSGAANGFLGKAFYDIPITDEYINKFNNYFKTEIIKNSKNNLIDVDFNRFYFIGIK